MSLAAIALLALVSGLFVGAIGVGGIFLVSGLIYVARIDVPVAIAACMFGYVLTGAVGTLIYARSKSIRWSMAGWLCLGAGPAALLGAWGANTFPPVVLELGIALLTVSAGFNALFGKSAAEASDGAISAAGLVGLGAVTGAGSALSGTGGPMILVPLLMWLKVPVLTAVGLSQAITLPISTLATAGNLLYGSIDVRLGLVLGVTLALGTWGGAKLAHRLPRETLRRIVAYSLVVVGAIICLKLVSRLLG